MRCFLINDSCNINDTLFIEGERARHIVNVLRLGLKDKIILFDDDGNTYNGIIIEKNRRGISVKIINKKTNIETSATEIILAQALTKGKKMDYIVQKSTELGISAIIPFSSSRCIPRWDQLKALQRRQHWQKIVSASVSQSGIRKTPLIEDIKSFVDLVSQKDFDGFLKLILWEGESEAGLRKVFACGNLPEKIVFVVGPEGGFSEDEIRLATNNGFIAVSLGNYILRVETVAPAVLAIIRYEKGELG